MHCASRRPRADPCDLQPKPPAWMPVAIAAAVGPLTIRRLPVPKGKRSSKDVLRPWRPLSKGRQQKAEKASRLAAFRLGLDYRISAVCILPFPRNSACSRLLKAVHIPALRSPLACRSGRGCHNRGVFLRLGLARNRNSLPRRRLGCATMGLRRQRQMSQRCVPVFPSSCPCPPHVTSQFCWLKSWRD